MDLMQREGNYPLPPQAPKTLGVEFSGVVEELASESESGFKKGDAVFGLAYGGAYAEYIAVSTHMLIHKPDELSWEECAGIPEVRVLVPLIPLLQATANTNPLFKPIKTWITAIQAMYLVGEYKPGQSVLWHAGASAVSIAGIQLSKGDGASAVYATTRSDEKNKFCVEQLGATAAFNSNTQDWAEELLKVSDGKGANVIIDFMSGSFFGDNLKAAAFEARIVNLASLTGTKPSPNVDLSLLFRKRIRYEGSTLRARDENYQGKLRDYLVEHALPKFKTGEFKVFVEKVMDWESIIDAHKLMESNKTKGKIIMTIPW